MSLPHNDSIPDEVYELVTRHAGEDFAGGFLSVATLDGNVLTPHTETRWLMIQQRPALKLALRENGWIVQRPLPFGHPKRPDSSHP